MKQLGVCVCVCVCVCEEEEIFAKEFRAELSALSAAVYQDEGNDRLFKKCSYVSVNTLKLCKQGRNYVIPAAS